MAPRKKATTGAATSPSKPQSSTRKKAPASKGKNRATPARKRNLDQSDSDGEKPSKKKVKKGDEVDNGSEEDDDQDMQEPAKMVLYFDVVQNCFSHCHKVTVLKRGAAPVDPTSHYVGTC
jgi:poly [ADP-ribose] polymerase 2/3/4